MRIAGGLFYVIGTKSDDSRWFLSKGVGSSYFNFYPITESEFGVHPNSSGYSSSLDLDICFWNSKIDAYLAIASIMCGGAGGGEYKDHSFVNFEVKTLRLT